MKVELIEDTIVIDNLGPDWLMKGTQGEVVATNEDTFTLVVGKKTYSEIPITSTKEVNAA